MNMNNMNMNMNNMLITLFQFIIHYPIIANK